jgi:hypothetical protein
MERGFFTGDFEKKVRLCLTGDLFYWGLGRYVKEGSGNGHLCL